MSQLRGIACIFFMALLLVPTISHAEIFPENQVVSIRTGFNEFNGVGQLVRTGNKYRLYFPVVFFGSTLFSKISPQEVASYYGNSAAPASYFGSYCSFGDRPEIQQRLLTILRTIEATFESETLSLKLEPVFPNECKLPGFRSSNSYPEQIVDLRQAIARQFSKTKSLGLPVIFAPLGERGPSEITPIIWPAGRINPILFAHEFAHYLGVMTEGYAYSDYPPIGLMNSEYEFVELSKRAPQARIVLLRPDFNEIMLALVRRNFSRDRMAEAEAIFSPVNALFSPIYRMYPYAEETPELLQERARAKVDDWLNSLQAR